MNTTVNVNLAGFQFTFDNDAYMLLSEYLGSLKKVFIACGDESEDIASDIERRCAEILMERYGYGSYIVTAKDISEIISVLGEPEDIYSVSDVSSDGDGDDDKSGMEESREYPEPPKLKKRLYRLPDDKILGGVCGGLAAYLGIDPTYLRLGVVALSFISGSFVAGIYILLWIIVPVARTPLQKLQLKGEALSLDNIGRQVNSWFSSVNSHTEGLFGTGAGYPENCTGSEKTGSAVWRVIVIILGLLAIPVLIAMCIAFVGVAAATLVSLVPVDILNSAGVGMFSFDWHPTFVLVTAELSILSIIMPLFALSYTAVRKLTYGRPLNRKTVTVYWVSWMFCLVAALLFICITVRGVTAV